MWIIESDDTFKQIEIDSQLFNFLQMTYSKRDKQYVVSNDNSLMTIRAATLFGSSKYHHHVT